MFIAIAILFFLPTISMQCSETPSLVPKYHLIEKCHRSKLGIAAKANYTSLTSCRRLGIEKRALSLNFSPPDAAMLKGYEPMKYTCEVLKCAEAEGGLSLDNDTRYDYYSIYGNPVPDVNTTCVPATGMFYLLTKKLNYTQAQEQCRNISAVLADVTGEQRTDALATVLAGAGASEALVGLTRSNSGGFMGVHGDALDCTTYRAWAPGHPRRYAHKFDCVVLTRHRTWKSVPCKQRYPVLCELIPGGPYKVGSIFGGKKKDADDVESNKVMSEELKNN